MGKMIAIEGMSCGHCVAHVKEALEELEGVSAVKVDLESKTAVFEGEVSDEKLKEAIEEAGYEVVTIKTV
jgi:copper ion binding protein